MTNHGVTQENYRSKEMEWKFNTNSQLKEYRECPKRWMHKLLGTWVDLKERLCFIEGNYVDYAVTEAPHVFAAFCERNNDKIYQKNGKKRANFAYLDIAIETIKKETVMMEHLTGGESQTIIAVKDFHGVPFKCKIDALILRKKILTDLKTTKSLYKTEYSVIDRQHVNFIDFYAYWTQLALYREAVWLKHKVQCECFIAAAEKKPKDTDHDDRVNRKLYHLDDYNKLEGEVHKAIPMLREMQWHKDNMTPPEKLNGCDDCSCCIQTMIITEPESIKPLQRLGA